MKNKRILYEGMVYVVRNCFVTVECEFYNGIVLPPKRCYELTGFDVVRCIVSLPTERLPKKSDHSFLEYKRC